MAITIRGAAMLFLLVLLFSEDLVLGFVKSPIYGPPNQGNEYGSRFAVPQRQQPSSSLLLYTSFSGSDVDASTNPTGERKGRAAASASAPPIPFESKRDSGSASAAKAAPKKAPLVDSTLLRFISSQKRMDIVLESPCIEDPAAPSSPPAASAASGAAGDGEFDGGDDYSSGDSERSSGSSVDDELSSQQGMDEPSSNDDRGVPIREDDTITDESSSRLAGSTTESNDIPGGGYGDSSGWLGQYNAHRIAQHLTSIGAEEEAAIEAGRVVQRHALGRTMRRRIRKFLRERDRMWAGSSASSAEGGAGTGGRSSPAVGSTQSFPNVGGGGVEGMDGNPSPTSSKPSDGGTTGVDAVIDLLTDAGLTGKDICAIFTHTPSVATMMARRGGGGGGDTSSDDGDDGKEGVDRVADRSGAHDEATRGETLEEIMERAFVGLLGKKLKLRRYDARKVLRTCPGLLTKRGSTSAEQVVTLLSSLGVSTSSLAREKTSLPNLLSRSPAAIFRLVAFLSSEGVRMPTKRIGPFLRRSECAPLLDAVAPVAPPRRPGDDLAWKNNVQNAVNDITFMEDFWGGRNEDRRRRIDETYRNMTATATRLRHEVGVVDVASMLSAKPCVLLLDVPTQISPVVEYLEEIEMWEEDIPRVLQSYPILLETDLSQMRQVVEFLHSQDVSEDAVGSIVRAFPSLLTLNVERKMIPVVDFLRDIGVVNIGRFITRLPPVLGYSVEKELKPKWEYLSQVCQFEHFEVVRFPAYFSYPLERVIKTRYEYLRDVKRVPISLVSIDDVVRFGDLDFATTVAGDTDAGEAFVAYATQRKQRKSPGGKRRPKKSRRTNKVVAERNGEKTPVEEATELQIENDNR